jgi:hypothetical protein
MIGLVAVVGLRRSKTMAQEMLKKHQPGPPNFRKKPDVPLTSGGQPHFSTA